MRFRYTNKQTAGEWPTEKQAVQAACKGDTLVRHLMQGDKVLAVAECKVQVSASEALGFKRAGKWEVQP